jgi:outer membrane protein insertion porin family
MIEQWNVIPAVLLLLSAGAIAQKPITGSKAAPTATYKLIALRAAGTQHYTEKEILPASGLALGQNVGEADFKEAARRLGDTGMFTDVEYSYSYSPAGMKVEFQFADADPSTMVPAHFENFVWFTDEQLLTELQRRVPLFKQLLPTGGTLIDRVEAALQEVLDEKQIPARVDYLRESTMEGEKLIGIAYSVEAMDIRIRNVEFPGATPDQLPSLQAAARKLSGARYTRSPLAHVAEVDFLPVCLKRGYLKASFGDFDARVVSQSGGDVEVDAILPLTPGKVYSTSSVDWKGNSAVAVENLQGLIHLPFGKPADAVQLVTDLEKVTKLYHSRGYMTARVTPKALLDDEKSTVHYDLYVVEGDQFKMGELEIIGLDSQAKAQLQTAWKLREGDPYNGEYPQQFVDETTRLLPRGVPWNVTIHEAVNEKDKTVDITVRFAAR